MFIKRFFGHLKTISIHKYYVFKYACKAGIPLQGLTHDLSKFSYIEFSEGVKYYTDGKKSPISTCKKLNGYSKAWLHHKGRNKHHFEYWYDFNTPDNTPIIPYKYVVEMICDTLAASKTYYGKNWTPKVQLDYFNNRKDLKYLNVNIKNMLLEVYQEMIDKNINEVINKKHLKALYKKHTTSPSK